MLGSAQWSVLVSCVHASEHNVIIINNIGLISAQKDASGPGRMSCKII